MALSRIWSAFFITSILVAAFKWIFSNDNTIFSRMVIGKADDPYDSVSYVMIGSPEKFGYPSADRFSKYLAEFGYKKKDSISKSAVLITDNLNADSVTIVKAANPSIRVFTYRSIQSKLIRKADGIIETCKGAVNISIGLIGIMALFMGFMTIAERAGGIRFLSRIIGPFFSKLFPEIPKGHPAMGHIWYKGHGEPAGD